jgi:hypothetical protein
VGSGLLTVHRPIVAAEIYTGLQGWSGIRSNVPETCELPCWHSCIEGKADTINDSATAMQTRTPGAQHNVDSVL